MEIILLKNMGFCSGVKFAYEQLLKIIKNNPTKKIYLIGQLVHNNHVSATFAKFENFSEIKTNDKIKTIKSINKKESIIILSAHGTEKDVLKFLTINKYNFFDLSCSNVKITYDKIITNKDNYDEILYLGIKNHSEAIGALSQIKNIRLITNNFDSKTLDSTKKYLVVNQTTISNFNYSKVYRELALPNVDFLDQTCYATTIRQSEIFNLDKSVDTLVVIGDKESNNTKELVKLGIEKKMKTYLVTNKEEIKSQMFEGVKKCAITAGASTPQSQIDEITNAIVSLQ